MFISLNSPTICLLLAAILPAIPLTAFAAPRVLAWDDAVAARKLALVSGANMVEITNMHPLKRTGSLKVKGEGPFFIRALDKSAAADGQPVQRACQIPKSIKYPLIVILPDESDATGVRLLVVDDDPAGFRWGTFRFLNATPKELIVEMERKTLRVPTGWKSMDLDLGGETRGVGARVALSEAIEKPLYSAVWEYNPNIRMLCFLMPGTDPRLSPVAFKVIPEDRKTSLLEASQNSPQSND